MGMGRFAVLAGMMLVASPAVAQAGPSNPNYPFEFKVPATNGYSLTVSAARGGPVELFARRKLPGGGAIGANYSTKGRVTLGEMRADFGRLGHVSVRMNWAGRFVSDTQCHHWYTYVARRATYTGRVVFREGFTAAQSSDPKPTITKPDPVDCGFTLNRNVEGATVLHAHSSDRRVSYAVERARPASPAFVFAIDRERLGRVNIARFIEGIAPPSSFTFDPASGTADLQSMPAGFQGTAHFQAAVAGRSSGSLSGTLTGAFPGGPSVNLTGSSYAADLESYFLFNGGL